MKKFIKIFSFLLVITSVTVFQACKDDDAPTPAPTATGPTTVASVQIGTTADVTFTFKADGGYANATAIATGGTVVVKTPGTAGATTGSVVVTFTADNTAGAATVTLTLSDAQGQAATAVAALNKTISAPPSVELSATTGNANPGSTTTVTVTVTAANGVKNVTYSTTGGLSGSPVSPVAMTGNTVELTFTVPADAELGAELTASISATDNQDLNSTSVLFTVTASTNELTGKLTADMTLEKGVAYLIKDQFIVMDGVTLTVEPGAVIRGDKASKGVLVVKQGGTLLAEGTVDEPIVFTSSKAVGDRDRGDWGGIVLMGNGYVNQKAKPLVEGLTKPTGEADDFFAYGTVVAAQTSIDDSHNTESSGKLKYVRIEYAGIELIPNAETNGLTMAGVGSGTEINYVQSSFGGDDGFEWFGGAANATHLVSLATWDDDFDTDFGWRGNVQYGLAVRAPFSADQSGSTSFESDSQGNTDAIGTVCDGTTATGCTQGVFSNMTVIGPRDFNNINTSGDGKTTARAISANYTRAMHIRRRTAISIFNSVITGYGNTLSGLNSTLQGLEMDDAGTIANYTNGVGGFGNNVMLYPSHGANAMYGSNVTDAAGTTVKAFWETGNSVGSASIVMQPVDATHQWSPQGVGTAPAGSLDPYPTYGLTADFFFGARAAGAYPSNPNWAVTEGDLIDFDAADLFASSKLANFFQTDVTYKGAFGDTDWTDGWSEFQPLNKAY